MWNKLRFFLSKQTTKKHSETQDTFFSLFPSAITLSNRKKGLIQNNGSCTNDSCDISILILSWLTVFPFPRISASWSTDSVQMLSKKMLENFDKKVFDLYYNTFWQILFKSCVMHENCGSLAKSLYLGFNIEQKKSVEAYR